MTNKCYCSHNTRRRILRLPGDLLAFVLVIWEDRIQERETHWKIAESGRDTIVRLKQNNKRYSARTTCVYYTISPRFKMQQFSSDKNARKLFVARLPKIPLNLKLRCGLTCFKSCRRCTMFLLESKKQTHNGE